MEHNLLKVDGKEIEGYIIPLSGVNLVLIKTDKGMLGCGAFNPDALDKFDLIAATVKSTDGGPITTLYDLLHGEIKEVNNMAKKSGMKIGQPVVEAVKLL